MKFKAFTLSICALIACFSITSSAKELYVSPSGDDSVSYSQNSNSSPWKTIAKGVYSIRAGDTLHIRGGNYAPFKAMRVRSDYDNQTYDGIINLSMDAESGTKDQPVLITAYENETVIIDLINAETFIHLDNKSYWSFEDLTFINGGKVFVVGQNNAAEHNSFRNLNITGALGGDNFGAIKLVNGNSEHTTIENNVIKGPGYSDQIHQNTSAIYLKSLNNVHIKNNVLSNAPIGIYYKHRTTESLAEDIDIQIDGNFIYNTPRSSMELNSNYATISNNIIGKNTGDIRLSNANGSPGGDYNVIDHNTFSGGSLNLSGKTQLGDPIPGAIGNKVFNNIFSNSIQIWRYSPGEHNTQSDFNLYPHDDAILGYNDEFTLAGWQHTENQDLSSKIGEAQFTSTSPETIREHKLLTSSPGKNSSSDGRDMGAEIDLGALPKAPTFRPR